MSAFVRAFVFCDDCHEPMDSSTVPSARNISEALREAKKNGWTRKRGGRDLCGYCTPAPAEETKPEATP
ncbi:hypothetical protein ACFVDT_07105 [Streptomyces sp. NPDC057699]|uniref:hypothetical protein n=1 Tax=Streptomyces sp. NPDC057699 TaxID=3346220 RepID=UPI003675AA4D